MECEAAERATFFPLLPGFFFFFNATVFQEMKRVRRRGGALRLIHCSTGWQSARERGREERGEREASWK